MLKSIATLRVLLLVTAAVLVHFAGATGTVSASSCIPDGWWDDTLGETDCCSGMAVPGSTMCLNPSDFGTTWTSCYHICASGTSNACEGMNQQYPGCNYSYNAPGDCCLPEFESLGCPQTPCIN